MLEIHPKHLWLGHAFDVREPRALFDVGIKAVVDLAYEEPPAQLPRQLIYCRFPINDGGGNAETVVVHALQTVVDLLASNTPTIVACSVGMSRSPTIAAFALAVHLSGNPTEIVTRIGSLKSLEINPALWKDVANAFERVRERQPQ